MFEPTSAQWSLEDLQHAGATIRAKADEFSVAQTTLGAEVDAAVKEFRNAKKPLPPDCRPDDLRVRKLTDAYEAAKQAAGAR
ncbi:hypothetical protein FOB72_17210 (plasmid) [Cupriavidus pauculus]|uniref:Uncharacterized protein n=1 Tax=Cupriavidus pauculus TaxID=82633 RepID=A0A5P2H9B1_9BURK|nr:hypothetical protein [Cupriavidus pauculus]QET03909.1 hypothetical protein FOB72_17210 [Cupriavidus pauculus]